MLEYGEIGRLELVRRTCQQLEEAAVAGSFAMESMENRVERDSKKLTEESSTDIGSYGGGGASSSVAWLGAKVREKELEQPACIGFREEPKRFIQEIERGGGEAEVTSK
uniref:Uncharacterized protein n=1 Tax=Fagus sylvatica TaxID=28930 RepID=A0A2N9HEN3_FAGSY